MDLDVTILIQVGILAVLLIALNGILFKPVLEVLDARRAKLEGARNEIEKLNLLAKEDLGAYQQRIRQANNEAQSELERLRDEGRERERQLLNEVRAEIADALNSARNTIERQEGEARQTLSAQVDAIAGEMASKVLGREVAS